MYQNVKYLTSQCWRRPGEVAEGADDEESLNAAKVVQGEIVAVLSVDQYKCCISCKGKVGRSSSGIGECTKCGAKMKLTKCEHKKMAKVIIEDGEGKMRNVAIFGEQMDTLIGSGEVGGVIGEKLLSINWVQMTNCNDVIISAKVL